MANRRQFLTTASGVAATALGGCLGVADAVDETGSTPTGTPTPTPVPMPEFDASKHPQFQDYHRIEKLIHRYTNRERMKRNRGALSWHPGVAYTARRHSRDMAERNYIAHDNPEGEDAGDRVANYNLDFNVYGENIAFSGIARIDSATELAKEVVNMWMTSEKGHRWNLLMKDATLEGVGVYLTKDGIYATQVLGVPDE